MHGDVSANDQGDRRKHPVVPGHGRDLADLARLRYGFGFESESQKSEREADAEGRGRELLGEQHQPDRPEQIQRPGDRAGDEDCGQRALR